MFHKRQLISVAVLALALGFPVSAATSAKDLAVATRALGFVEPSFRGSVKTVVYYNAGNSASLTEANQIRTALTGKKIKGAALSVSVVPASNVRAASNAQVVFLASGVGSRQSAIFDAASAANAITISSDLSCVRRGFCVVGVKSAPKTEIIVNRSAGRKSRVSFTSAFLMLVKEI